MVTFEDRNEITVQNPPIGKATLFYDENVLKIKDENGDIRIVTLADSIENAVSSGDYYTNSYVERLKALGSNVQYSNSTMEGTTSSSLTDGDIYLTSIYIPKKSTINGAKFFQSTTANYTASDYNGIGLYSFDPNTKDLTLIASSTNDGTLWQTAVFLTIVEKDFTNAITIEAGVYFLAFLYNSSAVVSAPGLYSKSSSHYSSAHSNLNLPTNVHLLARKVAPNISLPNIILGTELTTSSVEHFFYLY